MHIKKNLANEIDIPFILKDDEDYEIASRIKAMKLICTNLYLKRALFTDVILCCFEQEYKLHKIVLSQNEFFESLFSGNWNSSDSQRIELTIDDENISSIGFEVLIEKMYGNLNIKLQNESVLTVLATANYFGDLSLVQGCISHIVSNFKNPDTIVPCSIFIDENFYPTVTDELQEALFKFLCVHVSEEAYQLAFLHLSDSWIYKVLISDCFFASSECSRYRMLCDLIELGKEHQLDKAIIIIKKMIQEGVLYTNIYYSPLEYVPEVTIKSAIRDKQLIKNKILSSAKSTKTLDSNSTVEKEYTQTIQINPKLFNNFNTNLLLQPLRFGCEFENKRIRNLYPGQTDLLEKQHFYAGSYWSLVIHKYLLGGVIKLGLYVKRSIKGDSSDELTIKNIRSCTEDEEYIDRRTETVTWIKMFCHVNGVCYVFEKSPGLFSNHWDWGFKSAQLYKDAVNSGGEVSIKCSVILGHVSSIEGALDDTVLFK